MNENFRPEGWQDTVRGLLKHEIPFIRAVAVQNLPLPLDDATVALIAEAIKDDLEPVQGAACDLAYKAKLSAFGPPLVNLLERTENDWLLRAPFRSAAECSIENDRRLEICVRRMGHGSNDRNMVLLGLLIDGVIQHQGGYGSNSIDDWTKILPGIQNAWHGFIDANREAIRNGQQFKIAEPPVTREMFPPGFQFHRKGQPDWPELPPPPPMTPKQLTDKEDQSFRFMNEGVQRRIREWRETQPKTAVEQENYVAEFVINLDSPEFLLKDGTDRVRRAGLATDFDWTLHHVTPDGIEKLEPPVRLRICGLASQPNICKEVFLLQGVLEEGERGVFAEITPHEFGFRAGKGIANLKSYQFPDEQYAPTPTSIDESLLIKRQSSSK